MKRIFIKLLSISLCTVMLFTLCSCSVLDKITSNIEDKPDDETTKAPDTNVTPTVKYKRSDMKYTFLTVIEGFEEGTPAQLSYAVFDTANNTLSSLQIPVNTFVSGGNKTLSAEFKANYSSKLSDGRGEAVDYACGVLMDKLEESLFLACDYYIYFDKTSMTDLVNEVDGVSARIPFEMRFTDGTVIRNGNTNLTGDHLWKALCYGSYAAGSELNAAKLLFASLFYRLKESVSSDTISLFMMNVGGNLYTSVPKTNGVDVFFLRKLLALDIENYKFSSADAQTVFEGGLSLSVVCKNAFLNKVNTFLTIYETEIASEDFDADLAFCDNSSMIISGTYNSVSASSAIYTAQEARSGSIYIFAK